jgi:DNA-binding NarL/FixJ family response regulator
MNGLEAAKVLNTLMPSVPLIMYTAFNTQNLEHEAVAAGVRRLVDKNGRLADLIECVRSFCMKDVA